MRVNKFGSGPAAAALSLPLLLLLIASPSARGQWDVEYRADSLALPQNQSWTLYDNDSHFQYGIVGQTLHVNTMPPGSPYNALDWFNSTGHFDFASGFVLEARLRMVAATDLYARWGGAEIYSRSIDGYNLTIDIDPDRVILGSIYDYVTYPLDTTDAFHTYRAEAFNNHAVLFVDDEPKLGLPLASDNPIPGTYFGDQGWEGGEMYYEYVRYGVPEPASTALAGIASALLLGRLRRGRCVQGTRRN